MIQHLFGDDHLSNCKYKIVIYLLKGFNKRENLEIIAKTKVINAIFTIYFKFNLF